MKLRNRVRTEFAEKRHLLRQLPPRPMRCECPHLLRAKQKCPEGQFSPRAPITASALFAPHTGAPGGFHRNTNCKFPAPVLRACSSAHSIQEPGGCKWLPPFVLYSLFRLRPHYSRLGILRSTEMWMPAPLPRLHHFQCARSNAPNPEFSIRSTAHSGRNSISFNCTPEKPGLGTSGAIPTLYTRCHTLRKQG